MSPFIKKVYDTRTDRKSRWGGILEVPVISRFQRNCLDGGRVSGLKNALQDLDFQSIIDVGCGCGECSIVHKGLYCGLDNSYERIKFASRKYSGHTFLVGDAVSVPVQNQSFDMAMIVDAAHHFSDEQFKEILLELSRISRKYVVVSDPILYPSQDWLSSVLYRMDRGANFRSEEQIREIFFQLPSLQLVNVVTFKTFPGFYVHATFVLEIKS